MSSRHFMNFWWNRNRVEYYQGLALPRILNGDSSPSVDLTLGKGKWQRRAQRSLESHRWGLAHLRGRMYVLLWHKVSLNSRLLVTVSVLSITQCLPWERMGSQSNWDAKEVVNDLWVNSLFYSLKLSLVLIITCLFSLTLFNFLWHLVFRYVKVVPQELHTKYSLFKFWYGEVCYYSCTNL